MANLKRQLKSLSELANHACRRAHELICIITHAMQIFMRRLIKYEIILNLPSFVILVFVSLSGRLSRQVAQDWHETGSRGRFLYLTHRGCVCVCVYGVSGPALPPLQRQTPPTEAGGDFVSPLARFLNLILLI